MKKLIAHGTILLLKDDRDATVATFEAMEKLIAKFEDSKGLDSTLSNKFKAIRESLENLSTSNFLWRPMPEVT